MAYNAVKTASRLLGQNLSRSHTVNKCLIPSTCLLLQLNGNPTISYQQYRTKKIYRDYKFNKPLNFDHSGDGQSLPDAHKNELLFKYKDIAEIQQLPDELKKLFTAEYASAREKLEHKHMVLQDRMSRELGPAHSLEKQIAYLTVKIRNLIPKTIKMRANKCQKVHLLHRIDKRNKFLGYLRTLDFKRYEWIQHDLGLTYTPHNKYDYLRQGKKAPRKRQARVEAIDEAKKHLRECKNRFAKELTEVRKEKEAILREVKKYDLDAEKVSEIFRKDMQEKRAPKPKLSPRFQEYEEEKKRKKLAEAYVV